MAVYRVTKYIFERIVIKKTNYTMFDDDVYIMAHLQALDSTVVAWLTSWIEFVMCKRRATSTFNLLDTRQIFFFFFKENLLVTVDNAIFKLVFRWNEGACDSLSLNFWKTWCWFESYLHRSTEIVPNHKLNSPLEKTLLWSICFNIHTKTMFWRNPKFHQKGENTLQGAAWCGIFVCILARQTNAFRGIPGKSTAI